MLKNVEINHSLVYDFILSMARLNHNETLSGFIDKYDNELADKIKMDENILKWISKTYSEIPEKYKKYTCGYHCCLLFFPMCNLKDTTHKSADMSRQLNEFFKKNH